MRRVTRDVVYFKDRSVVDHATGCWLWQLSLDGGGYGRLSTWLVGGVRQTLGAHRAAWEAINGAVPDGLHVLHHCDVRRCCNPDHLFLGTHQDNMRDRESKGRGHQMRGSKTGTSKLTERDVGIIKMLLGLGVKGVRLGSLFQVTPDAVSKIRKGRNWAHVTAAPSFAEASP
jgi:hypothetical protein